MLRFIAINHFVLFCYIFAYNKANYASQELLL
jgi:hypothetical protein